MKKLLFFVVPTTICNFRCSYCYIAQRPEHFQGEMAQFKYTPEEVRAACSQKRIGGPCFMNFCGEGETLLTKDLDLYVKALVEEGHYAEVVTNLTVTAALEKFLSWNKELLKRLEFKCSFHYLELKKKGWLERFAENVHKIWDAGASANIELEPSDDLIPYIDEVKEYSMRNFGALPHLSILRNDMTKDIRHLTNLSTEEYDKIWSQFGSKFWEFKKTIFGKKRREFCYAGKWSAFIDISTGKATGCYGNVNLGNIFDNPDTPFPSIPVCRCHLAHCYNGHALLTLGVIPDFTNTRYGEIRDRQRADGQHWLQPELRVFFDGKLNDSNREYTCLEKQMLFANKFSKIIYNRIKSKLR